MTPVPCMRNDSSRSHIRADGSINASAYWRRKFNEGARHVLPHRLDRLVRNGGAMMQAREYDRLWRAVSDAIYVARYQRRRDHRSYEESKHIGLHQARTWLRRERAAQHRRIAA